MFVTRQVKAFLAAALCSTLVHSLFVWGVWQSQGVYARPAAPPPDRRQTFSTRHLVLHKVAAPQSSVQTGAPGQLETESQVDKVAMAADFVQTDEILPSPSAEQYFAPDEVDQPAAPVPDWKVDLDHVSIADAYSIELLIYISSTGSIDGYKIHRTTAGVEWIEMLLAPIFETEVSPAMRDGKPVASFLNVQFVIDSGF